MGLIRGYIISSVSGIAVRDSRFPDGTALVFTSAMWDAFLRSVKRQRDFG
jgi:uncharacterized protein DUF397